MTTDAYPPGWADGRSELQGADEPRCPGHPSGLHCAHWDTHDACCDCTYYITEDGAAQWRGAASRPMIPRTCKAVRQERRPVSKGMDDLFDERSGRWFCLCGTLLAQKARDHFAERANVWRERWR